MVEFAFKTRNPTQFSGCGVAMRGMDSPVVAGIDSQWRMPISRPLPIGSCDSGRSVFRVSGSAQGIGGNDVKSGSGVSYEWESI